MTEAKDVRVCSPFGYEMATPVVLGDGGAVVLEVGFRSSKKTGKTERPDVRSVVEELSGMLNTLCR
jgi:hypothetical protein